MLERKFKNNYIKSVDISKIYINILKTKRWFNGIKYKGSIKEKDIGCSGNG